MKLLFAPLLHVKVPAPFAVKVAEPPAHKEFELAVIETARVEVPIITLTV